MTATHRTQDTQALRVKGACVAGGRREVVHVTTSRRPNWHCRYHHPRLRPAPLSPAPHARAATPSPPPRPPPPPPTRPHSLITASMRTSPHIPLSPEVHAHYLSTTHPRPCLPLTAHPYSPAPTSRTVRRKAHAIVTKGAAKLGQEGRGAWLCRTLKASNGGFAGEYTGRRRRRRRRRRR